ncbi:hypothetical protein AKJ09_07526 [Labilithrix luteola]|uniref:Cytochrome c domain-containing protein n=1 Tax=Labilithrix luteola TaxID=1391654 RepID=A0A0K1Q555_9BACT|nr:hypothetical protein AKJ09_07526 [Labilithrix luteola]
MSGEAAIDAALQDAWKRAGITPAARADDATFLRRAYVDIVGSIPPPDVTTAFLASDDSAKRRKLVETLLASPAYAEHWMNYWDDVLMGRESRGQNVDRVAFRYWLRARFEANSPWDRIVRDLVSATGQNSTGGQRVRLAKAIGMQVPLGSAVPAKDDPDAVDLDAINGAVNWTLRFDQSPQDLAGNASRIFLGVQIQCAQCHDHKTEKWTQNDFRRFSSAFLHARSTPLDKGNTMGNVKRVKLDDFPKLPPRLAKNPELTPIATAHPTALDGTDLEKGPGTRKALADWMTSPKNPWFAKAIVNRVWGHMLGRGFYDPVDDMRASNEPVLVDLLDRMAADFVAHDFDLKYLIRTIAGTEAYQLSAKAPAATGDAKPDPENKLWSHFHLAPLGPEELLNALLRATNLEAAADKAGIKDMDQLRAQLVRQYAFLFDVDETDDTPDFSGTVTQTLSLLNGALVGQGSRAIPGSALSDVLAKPGTDEEKIDELALRVFGRKATTEERAKWVMYVQTSGRAAATIPKPKRTPGGKGAGALGRLGSKAKGGDPRREAYEDLFWAWLNSSEFVFNH